MSTLLKNWTHAPKGAVIWKKNGRAVVLLWAVLWMEVARARIVTVAAGRRGDVACVKVATRPTMRQIKKYRLQTWIEAEAEAGSIRR
jgi:hypothetical protein